MGHRSVSKPGLSAGALSACGRALPFFAAVTLLLCAPTFATPPSTPRPTEMNCAVFVTRFAEAPPHAYVHLALDYIDPHTLKTTTSHHSVAVTSDLESMESHGEFATLQVRLNTDPERKEFMKILVYPKYNPAQVLSRTVHAGEIHLVNSAVLSAADASSMSLLNFTLPPGDPSFADTYLKRFLAAAYPRWKLLTIHRTQIGIESARQFRKRESAYGNSGASKSFPIYSECPQVPDLLQHSNFLEGFIDSVFSPPRIVDLDDSGEDNTARAGSQPSVKVFGTKPPNSRELRVEINANLSDRNLTYVFSATLTPR